MNLQTKVDIASELITNLKSNKNPALVNDSFENEEIQQYNNPSISNKGGIY